MEQEQAARFAAQVLQQNHDGSFRLELEDDKDTVADALRALGCRVRYDLFRPDVLIVTPPVNASAVTENMVQNPARPG